MEKDNTLHASFELASRLVKELIIDIKEDNLSQTDIVHSLEWIVTVLRGESEMVRGLLGESKHFRKKVLLPLLSLKQER